MTPITALYTYAPAIKKIGGAILNGMSLFGNKSNSAQKSFEYSKALQQHQYELDRSFRQTAFGDTRKSLEDADYNPLLAVGQQAQGGSFGASMSVQDPNTENLQNRLAKISQMVEIASQRSQAKLNSANSSLADTQSKVSVGQLELEKQRNSAQVGLLQAQQDRQELENDVYRQTGLNSARAQIENLRADTNSKHEQSRLYRVEQSLRNAEIGEVGATIRKINADRENSEVQNSALRAQNKELWRWQKWQDKHPKHVNRSMYMRNYTFTGSNLLQSLKPSVNIYRK